MEKLNDIGLKYGTDKALMTRGYCHGYLDVYEKHFEPLREKSIVILEIGIFKGMSLKMWKEYFSNGKIYGMDLEPKAEFEEERVKIYQGNQENRSDLNYVAGEIGPMDIIIDDGGHSQLQQQVTLGCMFRYLKSGGIFVIEDLHTSNDRKHKSTYNQTNTAKTTLKLCEKLKSEKVIDSDFITKEEAEYVEENMSFCDVVKCVRSEICFIGKK